MTTADRADSGAAPGSSGRDTPSDSYSHAGSSPRRWFRQVEFWVLVLVVLGIHFTRLDVVMLHGEETRRATVAMEMLRSGDWIVPNLQGEVYFDSNRPPMQQWLIATLGAWRGDVDAVAVRLPSVLAVLGTTLLIFVYGRVFLSRVGAFAAAVAFPTMGEVLEHGGLGESDALFTLFVSASMLLWHIGFTRRWRPPLTWGVAYLCVALAALTKGPQGPVYFVASVGVFLLVTRAWRQAFTWAHAFGIVVFCAVWGAWVVPFTLRTDFAAVRHLYFGDVVRYGASDGLGPVAHHLVEYPIRLFACLLPWSIVMLMGYLRRDLRKAIGDAREPLYFCLGAILITLPTVWWVVRAETRFFIPLYPCFAVLFGIVFQRSVESGPASRLKTIWSRFAAGMSIVAFLTGAFIAVAAFVGGVMVSIEQRRSSALVLIVSMLVLGALLWRSRGTADLRQQLIAVACVAVFGGAVFSRIVMDSDVARATDKVAQVARARALIPRGATLYSFGQVDHGFAYFYRDVIESTRWPPADALPDHVEYFVFHEPFDYVLPFAWEVLEFVNRSTTRQRGRSWWIVVARRVPGKADLRPASELVRERLAATREASATDGP